MDISAMIRPEVRHFEPYLPGKPIEEVRRELGLKKIIKLASNENALGTSPKAARAIADSAKFSFRYPEGPGTLLKRAIAKKLGVNFEEVILGAGSDEIIEILGKTFFKPGDEIIVSAHAFIRYKMAGDLMGAKTVTVPMKDFKHDLKAMALKINSKTKAIFIANPNNPTGTYSSDSDLREFIEIYRARTGRSKTPPFAVFDEAYYEFAKKMAGDYPDTIKYFKENSNFMVLRTFSKAYGLAGLRIGYGIGKSEAVSAMDRVRPPFNVATTAQAGAIAALDDQAHIQRSVKAASEGMDYVVRELEKIGIPYLCSAGNFILIDVAPRKGKDVFKALLKKGVIVRAMDEYGFTERVRVSIGKMEENKFFIQKLKELYK